MPDESTTELLRNAQQGDRGARERLSAHYLPILRRWARGRLPHSARPLADTDDLVQVTLMKALEKVEQFEPRREGAFLAYLRTILRNQIVDQIRRQARRPQAGPLPDDLVDGGPSPLEEAIGKDAMEAYESALEQLEPKQREALVLRLELGWAYGQIAEALESPSTDAARMVVTRALTRVAKLMGEETT